MLHDAFGLVCFVFFFFPFAATILTLCSAASVCLQSAVWLIGQGQWDARGAAIYTHRRGGRECVIESGPKVCFFFLGRDNGISVLRSWRRLEDGKLAAGMSGNCCRLVD